MFQAQILIGRQRLRKSVKNRISLEYLTLKKLGPEMVTSEHLQIPLDSRDHKRDCSGNSLAKSSDRV